MSLLRLLPNGRSALASLLVALALVCAACSSSTNTKPPLSSTQMIQKASANFTTDNSLHFTLTADNIAPGIYAVRQADGDVVRPDKMKITGKSEIAAGFLANIGIILIGSNQYLSAGGGSYAPTSGLPDLLSIFSPNKGIGAILTQFQGPSDPTADTVGGVSSWKITGMVDSQLLAPFTGSTATTGTPIKTTLWIGKADYQIHQVTLLGKASDTDTAQSVRTFTLSNFNEQVTITAPTS